MTDIGSLLPTSAPGPITAAGDDQARGVWIDAWRILRRKPVFLVGCAVIGLLTVMAIAPGLFTSGDPNYGQLTSSLRPPSPHAWFGYDANGRDIWTRVVYGARASLTVGVACTLGTGLLGCLLGAI